MTSKKKVLITGSGKRVGRYIAEYLGLSGKYKVWVHHRDSEKEAKDCRSVIKAHGGDVEIIACDFSKPRSIKNMISTVGAVDLLINNASTYSDNNELDFSVDALLEDTHVNLLAPVLLSKFAMIQCPNLHVINFSDMYLDNQRSDHWTYTLSKRWLEVYSEWLALQNQKVRVNVFQFGYLIPNVKENSQRALTGKEKALLSSIAQQVVSLDQSSVSGKTFQFTLPTEFIE